MKKIYTTFLLLIAITCGSFTLPLPVEGVPVKIVRFYPNPATTVINFDFDDSDKALSFQIYNFLGKKMFDQQLNATKLSVPLDNYFRGLYVYQLRDKAGNIVSSGKFQVVR